MSRWIEEKDGVIHEELACTYECKLLINDVCTSEKSDMCCDFPHPDYCRRCEHFVKEDGIIEKN